MSLYYKHALSMLIGIKTMHFIFISKALINNNLLALKKTWTQSNAAIKKHFRIAFKLLMFRLNSTLKFLNKILFLVFHYLQFFSFVVFWIKAKKKICQVINFRFVHTAASAAAASAAAAASNNVQLKLCY